MTDEQWGRYTALMHAVQTGIAWQISIENGGADVNADANLQAHKHLRVGIDGSKSDQGALVKLLIAKGVFTEQEYNLAIIEGAEREKATYEEMLSAHLGKKITLA